MNGLQTYYRDIKQALSCPRSQKRKFMQDIQCAVSNYLQEHPDADIGAVTAHFGAPQQISDAYLAELPPQKLRQQLTVKKWIVGIIAAAAACALLVWGLTVGIALVNELQDADGYLETYPIVIEE